MHAIDMAREPLCLHADGQCVLGWPAFLWRADELDGEVAQIATVDIALDMEYWIALFVCHFEVNGPRWHFGDDSTKLPVGVDKGAVQRRDVRVRLELRGHLSEGAVVKHDRDGDDTTHTQ
eukprot:CAMPEP_0175151288 /NCGR_PEP_ID=MMETSP0087-20121206/18407_1 /TAXON_ID=136419 /ORGANISM="Unknown Unknown, Strain D1" /LENGTH=119 /DNA_ID=CAMNT_0016437457 /DNA_START=379 /DNA_END=738 /DNA_ORIENTATION=-